MKRLFTFGCSLTNWIWPTWADIYATDFDFFENWGMPSAGNLFIFNSIIEANRRHKFTSNDTIVIMWSGLLRVDTYHHDRWNLYESSNDSVRGSEIINFAYIDGINEWFKSKNLNYKFLSMTDYSTYSGEDVYEFYKNTIDSIKVINFQINSKRSIDVNMNRIENYKGCHEYVRDLYNHLRGNKWPDFEEYIEQYPKLAIDDQMTIINREIASLQKTFKNDLHPTPIQHLNSLMEWDKDFTPSQQTLDWIQTYEDLISIPDYVIYNTNMPKERLK